MSWMRNNKHTAGCLKRHLETCYQLLMRYIKNFLIVRDEYDCHRWTSPSYPLNKFDWVRLLSDYVSILAAKLMTIEITHGYSPNPCLLEVENRHCTVVGSVESIKIRRRVGLSG